jgi:sialic acid synthase
MSRVTSSRNRPQPRREVRHGAADDSGGSACGASAAKLQKRDNDTLYSRALLDAPYDNEHSFGRTYGEHRRVLEFGERDYLACRSVARAAKVDFFATAFDEASADFLMNIGVPAIKIASGGLTDIDLLKHVGSLGVPIILSTGGGTWEDVDTAVDVLTRYTSDFALLHCTAAYPVLNFNELNLLAIVEMRARYPQTVIGWSGHDSGIAMALVAYAYGARILEKHFTH